MHPKAIKMTLQVTCLSVNYHNSISFPVIHCQKALLRLDGVKTNKINQNKEIITKNQGLISVPSQNFPVSEDNLHRKKIKLNQQMILQGNEICANHFHVPFKSE